jgi:hypothetical protein
MAANKIWTGATNNVWNTSGNWSEGTPVSGDNIIIDPSNYSSGRAPVISSSSAFSPNDITIQNGGSLTINDAITVTGDVTVTSASTLTTTAVNSGFIYFNGTSNLLGSGTFIFANVVLNSGKALNHKDPATIIVKGSWTNNGGTFIPNTNKVIFNGTVIQYINGTATTQTFYNLETAKTSQSLRIGGSLTVLNVHDFTQTSFKFHDSALSVFNVSGNFIHTSGTFEPCNNITISGNIMDNDTAKKTGLNWGAIVTLNGSVNQLIGGTRAITFKKLIINNTSSSGVTLQQPISIDSSLTLTRGTLYSDANNLVIINNNATCTSGSSISFIDGSVQKVGNSPFVFPVGNAGVWARLEMVNDANFLYYSSTTKFTCTYHKTAAPNNTNGYMSAELHHVSYKEYWDLERTYDVGNDAKCNVRLYWEDTAVSGISKLTDLKVAHFLSGSNVYKSQGGIVNASGKTGTITSTIPLTSFSPFTFGSAAGINPLPITLINFYAKVSPNHQVELTWETAAEINNSHFTIERSADGINYEEVIKVKGAGTYHQQKTYSTIDKSPYTGISYYRLKQTDFDGKSTFHKPVHIEMNDNKKEYSVYPNPLNFNESLFLKITTHSDRTIQLTILDQTGKLIYSKPLLLKKEYEQIKVNPTDYNLSSGMYSIVINDGERVHHFRLIVN